MLLLGRRLLLLRFGALCGRRGAGRGVVDAQFEGGGWADGHDARAKFYADGYVVVGGEAAFAEADG